MAPISLSQASALVFVLLGLLLPLAAPTNASAILSRNATQALEKRYITPNAQGYHSGFFFKWWSDGGAPTAEYNNLGAGRFRWVLFSVIPELFGWLA